MEDEAKAQEIAFHLTDWDDDLEGLIKIYESEETLSDDEISRIIFKLLVHLPEHLAAAKKLAGVGLIQDIFDVGITEEDDY